MIPAWLVMCPVKFSVDLAISVVETALYILAMYLQVWEMPVVVEALFSSVTGWKDLFV
jgi:hypothetical protein